MAQPLVGEAGGRQKLEAFDLAKVCSLAQGEEVEQLRDIVPPASVSRIGSNRKHWELPKAAPEGEAVAHRTLGS